MLRLLARDPARVDDLCQAAALRMWELFDTYDASRPFDAWARGVAAKVALEMDRAERRTGAILSPEAVATILDGFDRDPLQRKGTAEILDALETCLERLDPRMRALVEKKYIHALPIGEVAAGINKSVEMTYKLLQGTKRTLAECIRRRLTDTASLKSTDG